LKEIHENSKIQHAREKENLVAKLKYLSSRLSPEFKFTRVPETVSEWVNCDLVCEKGEGGSRREKEGKGGRRREWREKQRVQTHRPFSNN
jgi:hypothetical protein